MPAIKINICVNAYFERFIRYDEGENPRKILDQLINESTESEYADFLDKLVPAELKRIPHLTEIEPEICSGRMDIEHRVECPNNENVPRWNEFMSLEQIERYETESLREQLYEALENATYNNKYDRIIELATQLKKLTDNE